MAQHVQDTAEAPDSRIEDEDLDGRSEAVERAGVDTEMGFKLRGALVEAGLPEPRTELKSPSGTLFRGESKTADGHVARIPSSPGDGGA